MTKRYNLIDFLRGFTLIHMIIYHLIFDLENFYGFSFNFNFYYYQQYICMSFIFLAGLCENFSGQRLKRILILGLAAGIITIGSFIFDKTYAIYFGILHFFFLSGLIFYGFSKFFKIKNTSLAFFISLSLFIIFKGLEDGNILFGLVKIPQNFYAYNLFVLGLPGPNFKSGDYFPIIPWIFLYFSGFFSYKFFKLTKKEPAHNIFNIMGRHSLIVYLIHQGVLVGLLNLFLG